MLEALAHVSTPLQFFSSRLAERTPSARVTASGILANSSLAGSACVSVGHTRPGGARHYGSRLPSVCTLSASQRTPTGQPDAGARSDCSHPRSIQAPAREAAMRIRWSRAGLTLDGIKDTHATSLDAVAPRRGTYRSLERQPDSQYETVDLTANHLLPKPLCQPPEILPQVGQASALCLSVHHASGGAKTDLQLVCRQRYDRLGLCAFCW